MCGLELAEAPKCEICGTEYSPFVDVFCSGCGVRVRKAEPTDDSHDCHLDQEGSGHCDHPSHPIID